MGEKNKSKQNKPQKKAFKWWILFIILALICGAIVFCVYRFKKMNVNYEKEITAPASFKKISRKVIDVISDNQEEFMDSTPDERKKIAERIMDELVEQGALKEENIGFDEENNVYQFVTNDGALNFIVLNDYDPNYMGMSDTQSNSDGGSGESGGTDGKNRGDEAYQYFHDGYPYSDEDLMAEDLDMLFFTEIHMKPEKSDSDQDGYNYHKFFEDHAFQLCNQAHVKYKDIPQTTVEELKTCLKGYDYVSLDFHGFYYSNIAKVATLIGTASFKNVFTNLEQFYGLCRLESYLKDLYNEVDTTFLVIPENVGIGADICYKGDLVNGRLARHLANFGYNYLITPIFFYDYYDENDLNGTIVHLGACEGFKNETLPATFKACGAEAVVGYDESVHTDYSVYMEWRILHWLLYGGTIGESASFAKRLQGDKDPVKPYARLKIYGDKDAVLIKNAVCHKDYVLIDKSMSYEEAVKYCNDIGGRIAVVENPAEQRALNTLLKTAEKNCYWIGLKKGDGGSLYQEGSGQEQKYHFHWAMDEPSGDGTHVMVYGRPDEEKGSKIGEWNDVIYDPNLYEGFYAADQFGIVCELSGTEATAVGTPEEDDVKTGQKDDEENDNEENDNAPALSENKPKWVCTKETCYKYSSSFTDGSFDYSREYEYDASGRRTKMTDYTVSWSNDIVSDHYHEYVYDASGNMISDTDYFADGRWYYWTDFEYDAKGLMTKKIFHFHVRTNNGDPFSEDPFGNDNQSSSEVFYEYDENGRLTKEVHYDSYDKLDDWSEKVYDLAGNMIKDTYYDGDGSLERYNAFEYDKQGNLLRETFYDSNGNLSASYVNEYDAQGNLCKSEHYNADDVLFEIELYEYDSSGNKTMYSRCYADGSSPYREEYEYDANGNNTKLTSYGSKGHFLNRYEYEYKFIPGDNE